MQYHTVGVSKLGLVRQENEDRLYMGEKLFIVADGMGGYIGGALASSLTIDTIKQYIQNHEQMITERELKIAIQQANQKIYDKAHENTSLKGMGSTAVAAYIDNDTVMWANVGDSRLYLYRENTLYPITRDHSLVQTLVDAGTLPESERHTHPQKNYLTRAVGVEDHLFVDTGCFSVFPGDIILLCSDGLSSYVSNSDISQILQSTTDLTVTLDTLVSRVYEAGARDNVSIILTAMDTRG